MSYSLFLTSYDSTLRLTIVIYVDSHIMMVMLSSLILELHLLKQIDEPLITAERVPLRVYCDESQ